MTVDRMTLLDVAAQPWQEHWNEQLGRAIYVKPLQDDAQTGVSVRMLRYPAGVMNVRHMHTCAHGMLALEGSLVTQDGELGPGSFAWIPAGMPMQHGASARADVTVLFITNRAFDITYLPGPPASGA